jgi:hypothetical protein
MSGAERREFQRLRLREPIPARFGETEVMLVELGVLGARGELSERITTGTSAVLTVDKLSLQFDALVVYEGEGSAMSSFPWQIGLRFISAFEKSDVRLRDALTRMATEELEVLRRFAVPADAGTFNPEETAMRMPAPFISYRFDSGVWNRRGVFVPSQPDNGFTAPDEMSADEIRHLSSSYEESDEEGRRLIRLFAELRICERMGIPPVKQTAPVR